MSADDTLPPQRRAEDPRIALLVKDMETVKGVHADMQRKLDENTAVTQHTASTVNDTASTVNEIKDILTTFRTLGTFAKWISSIGAAIIGLVAAWKGLTK